MKSRILGIALVSFLLLFSCNNDDDGSQAESAIEFTDIGKDALYGNGKEGIVKGNMIITNQMDWKALMAQMDSVNNTTDKFSETDIDFERFMVLAVFLEVKGSGWEIEITKVTENKNSVNVSTIETPYGYTVMTQPFHIIKIHKTEKLILFK